MLSMGFSTPDAICKLDLTTTQYEEQIHLDRDTTLTIIHGNSDAHIHDPSLGTLPIISILFAMS